MPLSAALRQAAILAQAMGQPHGCIAVACLKAPNQKLAELLYRETDPEEVKTLEGIEKAVRGHLLQPVGSKLDYFYLHK